jgi:hypothetical protein
MESLHELVFLGPPISQPEVKRLSLFLCHVNSKRFPIERAVKRVFVDDTRDVANRHIFSHIKSADVHVDSGRRYPIEENRS